MQNKENALLFRELEELQAQNHKDHDSLKEKQQTIISLKKEIDYLNKELEQAKTSLYKAKC